MAHCRHAAAQVLLAHGADPNRPGLYLETPLHKAAALCPSLIKTLLDWGANPLARDRWEDTPLHCAARYGTPESVRALLAAGADPTQRNSLGPAPLHCALFQKNLGALEVLLAAGADPNQPRYPPSRECPAEERNSTPLELACAYGLYPAARTLLRYGANPEPVQPGRSGPIHFAARCGDGKLVRLLLSHGADPRAKDEEGRDAAAWARTARHPWLAWGIELEKRFYPS